MGLAPNPLTPTTAPQHERARSVLFNLQSPSDKVWAMVGDNREHLIQEEKKKIRRLRVLVDLTTSVLYQDAALTLEEAQQLVRGAEKAILKMFPDKQQTFDIVLRPRFERILRERWG